MIVKQDFIYTPKGANRPLHIYLPDDWAESGKRYPVMYFFDGHNLFFDHDATYGKCWGFKDFLDSWDKELIMVGIECGHEGQERLSEYLPYPAQGYFGQFEPTGEATMDWIVNEIKPMIDEKYPTIPFEDYLPRRQHHFCEIVKDGIPVKEGAHELLTYLKDHGYLIGMATSTGHKSAMEHLERTGMLEYFSPNAIITGDMVENGKPAPDIYLLAAERLGVIPSECIGVEDSLNGVRAIHAAGMRAVMIPDIVEPTPEVEALAWKRCEGLPDIIPLLEAE